MLLLLGLEGSFFPPAPLRDQVRFRPPLSATAIFGGLLRVNSDEPNEFLFARYSSIIIIIILREFATLRSGIFLQLGRDDVRTLLHAFAAAWKEDRNCLLYTSPSPRDLSTSRMPSSA